MQSTGNETGTIRTVFVPSFASDDNKELKSGSIQGVLPNLDWKATEYPFLFRLVLRLLNQLYYDIVSSNIISHIYNSTL